MYIPKAFEVQDQGSMFEFIRANSFGILFSSSAEGPFATHLPFLLDFTADGEPQLIAHMAKGNPHWKRIDSGDVLVVFHGAHQFIPSAWYEEPDVVPTWNYMAVHVTGQFQRVDNTLELRELMDKMMAYYEPQSDIPSRMEEDYFQKMLHGIVGFRVTSLQIEGKWKLSQNQSDVRQRMILSQLQRRVDPNAAEIASQMQSRLEKG